MNAISLRYDDAAPTVLEHENRGESRPQRGQKRIGVECLRHTTAILREDEEYTKLFGQEIAKEFIEPHEGQIPRATFMVGLYQEDTEVESDAQIPTETLEGLDELGMSRYIKRLPSGVFEQKHRVFERRTHSLFLDTIGVQQVHIDESTGRNLELEPSNLARPLVVGIIRESEDPNSRILQVNYKLAEPK